MAVFGLGAFACIASIVRMAMTQILYANPDRTWNISSIAIWATLEVNIGIICSCLMFLPAFLHRHLPESTRYSLSRLWDYTLSTIGLGSKKSSSSLAMNSGQMGAWPGHARHTDSATHHPFVEMKPTSSQTSNSTVGRTTDSFHVSNPPPHSFKFGFENTGGVY
ncbi:hypothetical protein B0H66DRAFT_571266 [Apodospora peruviana]|uniref:Rhodopsin domain-containing protein n=1 Tax=Apodospora peruviana TaxID=516989 RepID=A0AAE0HSP3_9PEZI|nr:hypothetical protein B0H66DRAFT_571266 [Apodospora peruviana]